MALVSRAAGTGLALGMGPGIGGGRSWVLTQAPPPYCSALALWAGPVLGHALPTHPRSAVGSPHR